MNNMQAEQIISEYLKPVFGFALKRCKSPQDAEDLSQEIILRAYRALIKREDIEDTGKFIRTIAHNALSNYYRDHSRLMAGSAFEEAADPHADMEKQLLQSDACAQLRREIAYLAETQRRILIACYFENKKQEEIARELQLPLGTVKWHLFEARKELKRGMETMRKASELSFNPISFSRCGLSGSIGSMGGTDKLLKSQLSQNILYAVWKKPLTAHEIADALSVSPVFVQDELRRLEEFQFVTAQKDKYLCNILLEQPSSALNRLQDNIYEQAANIFANELYDALIASDIWQDAHLLGGCTKPLSLHKESAVDRNFALWTLIPFIAAFSGKPEEVISFDEAATLRPDGGHNICYATINDPAVTPPKFSDSMARWIGPCWNKNGNFTFWQIDTEWSAQRIDDSYTLHAERIFTLLDRYFADGSLSADEYAYLSERGIFKTLGSPDGIFKAAFQCLYIDSSDMKQKLIAIGEAIRLRHKQTFDQLRRTYTEAVLRETPKHLHTLQKYTLQFLFCANGWFILHCLKTLVHNGKLQPPTEDEKRALTMLVIKD